MKPETVQLELFSITTNTWGQQCYASDVPSAEAPVLDFDAVDEDWLSDEPAIRLRPYQTAAVEAVIANLYGQTAANEDEASVSAVGSTLLVMATGLGKSCCAAELVRRRRHGKAIVIAHREELVYQMASHLELSTGLDVQVEMAERCADPSADIIVASVQTLISGMGSDGRMVRFRPEDFGLMVTDEAHHSVASSYQRVYRYFNRNQNIRHVGLTATPDRADEEALGRVFATCAYRYEIGDAIKDGWLVPLRAVPVMVDGLDYSTIRTTAGDLNGKDLAHVMEEEAPVHEMVQAAIELACRMPKGSLSDILIRTSDEHKIAVAAADLADQYPPRKTLVFAASVKHAERMAEVINRWLPGRACFVCGETPKEIRRQVFADYHNGRHAFLVNVGICTEGWDEPGIEVIVMGRPTKSRSLYCQCVGRGTRTLPGVLAGLDDASPAERRAAIAASKKKNLDIIDFVGNAGRHSLIGPADVLGGNCSDEVVAKAKKIIEDGEQQDVGQALEDAQKKVDEDAARERARRAKVRVGTKYKIGASMDPFEVFAVSQYRERGWEQDKKPSEGMRQLLERNKCWRDDLTYSQARQLVQGIADRRNAGLASYRQSALLVRNGLPRDVPISVAKSWIDRIVASNWKCPDDVREQAKQYQSQENGDV